jgi:hypothetical protein
MQTATRLVMLAGTLALVHACGDETGPGNVGPEGVIYEGSATDEALVVLLATAPKASATSVTITAPTAGQVVPAATPMVFSWTGGLSAAAPGAVPLRTPVPARRRHALAALVDLFRVRPAFAHPFPLNGQGYYLRVISNNTEIVKVFTSEKTYTPDAAAWQRLTSAGGELRATMLSAFFEKNNVTSDGGPVEATPVSFRISQ